MDARTIALIVFASIFGSAMIGFLLGQGVLQRHLDNESKDIVKLATGLIATLSALVLGLLVSTAKGTFDQVNNELTQTAVKVVVLDRVLAEYGPEAKDVRALLKTSYTEATAPLISGDEYQQEKSDSPQGVARLEGIQAAVRALVPKTEAQKGLQARAIQISNEIASSRWLLVIQRQGSISVPLLVIMVFWLSVIFGCWGLFSPRNLVVAAALLASALSVSGATFLILEMDRPLTGWIRVSSLPMERAVSHLGE